MFHRIRNEILHRAVVESSHFVYFSLKMKFPSGGDPIFTFLSSKVTGRLGSLGLLEIPTGQVACGDNGECLHIFEYLFFEVRALEIIVLVDFLTLICSAAGLGKIVRIPYVGRPLANFFLWNGLTSRLDFWFRRPLNSELAEVSVELHQR